MATLEPKKQATILVEVLGERRAPSADAGSRSSRSKSATSRGSVRATWFNQPWVAQKLTPGTPLLLTGSRDKRGFRVS